MKYYLFLALLATSFITNAQLKENYKKGWIIKGGTKKNGFIKSNDLEKLSKNICFKANLENESCQTFNVNQVSSFSLGNGNTYDALHLKMNNKKIEIDLFANILLKSEKLSLYKSSYKSEIFYVISKDTENYVLQNDKLGIGESEITKYNYQGVLNYVTEGLAFKESKSIKFSEDNFIRLINKFNDSKGLVSNDVRIKEKPINYYLINAGLGFKENVTEYYAQGMVRKYFPKLSRSTSLNFGISYFNYSSKEADNQFKVSLISVPLQIQQNLSNKKIRPYLFAGVALNYSQTTDQDGNTVNYGGFQKTNGVNFPYGIGIEIDIYKGFYFKSEYRDELFVHPILFGIGYVFSKK